MIEGEREREVVVGMKWIAVILDIIFIPHHLYKMDKAKDNKDLHNIVYHGFLMISFVILVANIVLRY